MGLLGKGIVRPLTEGEHEVQFVRAEEGLASNGNEYITLSYRADGEPAVRNRALFEMEYNLFINNVSEQVGYEGDDDLELLNILQEQPFKIWVVKNTVENKDYFNWYYRKPAPKSITTQTQTEELEDL